MSFHINEVIVRTRVLDCTLTRQWQDSDKNFVSLHFDRITGTMTRIKNNGYFNRYRGLTKYFFKWPVFLKLFWNLSKIIQWFFESQCYYFSGAWRIGFRNENSKLWLENGKDFKKYADFLIFWRDWHENYRLITGVITGIFVPRLSRLKVPTNRWFVQKCK